MLIAADGDAANNYYNAEPIRLLIKINYCPSYQHWKQDCNAKSFTFTFRVSSQEKKTKIKHPPIELLPL